MVSTRPSPNPARGRIAYPTAATYTPGDDNEAPTYSGSEPIRPVTSQESSSDQERSQGLKTWWKGANAKPDTPEGDKVVFGVPLAECITYASVQISTAGEDGKLYVWGVIPVVVAKCGLYLKEYATEVEGAFRISGSAKRMREMQAIFDTAPRYGKDIDWKALDYSPHDVATIFRRFLTLAPESIIPTEFYEDFRAVLGEETPAEEAILRYKDLVRSIPPVNQYLLLYVLDLLSVFARKADKNLMGAPNLALIFQPGVLSHPVHAMRPREHVLSQQVLEFLIEHQDSFLIGMELNGKKAKRPKKPKAPKPPPPVKADADLMLPSDSDDDVPEGGYYVIEGTVRSPVPGGPTELPLATSIPPSLIPPSPVKVNRSLPSVTSPNKASLKISLAIKEEMEASDSDEDKPSGGYEVHISEAARARQERASATVDGQNFGKGRGPSKRRGSLTARLLGAKEES